MSRKPIVVAGCLLLAAGIAFARQDKPPGPVTPELPSITPLTVPSAPVAAPVDALPKLVGAQPAPFVPPLATLPTPPAPPKGNDDLPLDELMDMVEKLRAEKAAIEKKEQELVKVIQKKAAAQKERMQKLGMVPSAMPPIPIVPVGGIAPPVPSLPR